MAAVIDGTIDSRHWWDTVTEVCRRIGAAAAPAVFVIAAMTLVITEVVEYIMMLSEKMYEDLQRTKRERHEKSRKKVYGDAADQQLYRADDRKEQSMCRTSIRYQIQDGERIQERGGHDERVETDTVDMERSGWT